MEKMGIDDPITSDPELARWDSSNALFASRGFLFIDFLPFLTFFFS
jgi:hypothetical protein